MMGFFRSKVGQQVWGSILVPVLALALPPSEDMSTKVSLIGLAVAGLVYSHPPPWTHADGWDEPWHGSKHDGSKSDANLVDTDLTILTHDDLYGTLSDNIG